MQIGEYEFEIKEGMIQRELESFFAHLRRVEVQEYEDDKGRKRKEERAASPERNGDYIRVGISVGIMTVRKDGEIIKPNTVDGIDPRVITTMASEWNKLLTEYMTPIVPN